MFIHTFIIELTTPKKCCISTTKKIIHIHYKSFLNYNFIHEYEYITFSNGKLNFFMSQEIIKKHQKNFYYIPISFVMFI